PTTALSPLSLHDALPIFVRLFTQDAAILEAQETRKDIPCTVTPVKPMLGFDLKFHAGYDVSVPLKELAGSDNQLTMVSWLSLPRSEEHTSELQSLRHLVC